MILNEWLENCHNPVLLFKVRTPLKFFSLVTTTEHKIFQLNQFLNYLLQRKLNFSVAGLFTLDGSLLISVS